MLSLFWKVWDFIRHPTHTRTMGIAIILVLVSAVSLTVIVAQQQQGTKQRASGEECKLDTTSCETEFSQCLSQCDISKSNTAKFYTCTIYSYNDQNCQEQINAIGGGACGEQDVSTGCNDLGEENGSSKTVCFEDSSCAASNNDNCVTSCGQQKSICDNNITVQYNNCLKVAQENTVSSPTEATAVTEVPTVTPTKQLVEAFTQQLIHSGSITALQQVKKTIDDALANGTINKEDYNKLLQTYNEILIEMPGEPSSPTPNSQPAISSTTIPAQPSPTDTSIPTNPNQPAQTQTNLVTDSCPLKSKGDANCDGKIDILDFNIWREEFTKALNTTSSDFNNDGRVNTLDFNIWRDNSL